MKNTIFFFFAFLIATSSIFAQSKIDAQFFQKADALLKQYVKNGGVDYAGLQKEPKLKSLIQTIETANLNGLDGNTTQAFLINAYNLLVIEGAVAKYPLKSVLDVPGFFDRQKRKVAGKQTTLNDLERKQLLDVYNDARFHFVLVCGALGCPPITNFAYQPDQLEQQLEQQTRLALNDPNFVRVDAANKKVGFSQIFKWYVKDFGSNNKTSLAYINRYRKTAIPSSYKISFYDYNWSLNNQQMGQSSNSTIPTTIGGGNNASRYVTSSTIPTGTIEFKVFNNLYTQKTGDEKGVLTDRSTFFTSAVSLLYGVNSRFNAGINFRYRRVRNDALPSSPFGVLGSAGGGDTRQGITAFGPQIRWAPIKSLPNFSLQSTWSFAVGDELEGNSEQPFIDWNGSTWNTQLFNDLSVGNNFSFFTELDLIWEDIGGSEDNLNRFSTPVTLILSYFPNPKTTIYALTGFSPFWQSEFDYFAQAGLGTKYQITRNVEVELLYTAFTNKFLQSIDGQASTINIGFRFSLLN